MTGSLSIDSKTQHFLDLPLSKIIFLKKKKTHNDTQKLCTEKIHVSE